MIWHKTIYDKAVPTNSTVNGYLPVNVEPVNFGKPRKIPIIP